MILIRFIVRTICSSFIHGLANFTIGRGQTRLKIEIHGVQYMRRPSGLRNFVNCINFVYNFIQVKQIFENKLFGNCN